MKKYIIPFLTIGLACSCVEDEGNYDITPMNQVSIDGMESRYSLLAYLDELEIDPQLTGSIYGENESNYEYKWLLCHNKHTHEVLGTERKLTWKADVPEGVYSIHFYVKDKNTDVEKIFSTEVRTSSPFNTGLMIVGKDLSTGTSALDMLTMAPNRDTIMVEDVIDMSGMNITEPRSIITTGAYNGLRTARIWLNGEDESYCLLSEQSENTSDIRNIGTAFSQAIIELDMDYDKKIAIRDMFPHQSVVYGRNLSRSNQCRGYITKDVIVFGMITSNEYYTRPVNCYSAGSSNLFTPYPLCFCPGAYRMGYMMTAFYDMDNDCFAKPDSYYFPSYSIKMTSSSTAPWSFDLKSQGRKLVYGENGYESPYGYSNIIVRNAEDDGTRYIYRFVLSSSTWIAPTQSPVYTVDPSIAPDFDKASHYMFSSNRTAVLYSVGNRLYQYDYARRLGAYYDFPAEICFLKADFVSNGNLGEYYVATYSEQDKGMIYKMFVPSNANAVEFETVERMNPETNEMEPIKWPTRLKVTDIEWKTN